MSQTLGYETKLGIATSIMLQSNRYHGFSLACLDCWTWPAILLNQIKFFWSDARKPVGYVTWAYLAPDTEERVKSDPNVLLHISEWNEGEHLWFMDMTLLDGRIGKAIDELASVFPGFAEARFVRRDAAGVVRKISSWGRTRPHQADEPTALSLRSYRRRTLC